MYPVTEDFIQKMKADRRRVLARVEVDYTDPFLDQSLEFEANEQANVSYPQQTADSVDQTTRKYACLDGTWDLTSGEYHLAPSADQLTQQQFGWWGAQFCDQDGYFSQPYPTLTIRHLPRPIRSLRVVGDIAREEWPVDFQIKLYGPDDTLLKTETITDNDQISWSKTLDPEVLDVAKQELIITRWSLPGTCAKIVEFFTSIREVYETGDLVSLRLLEEREASQGSLPVGNISSNEITLALNNEDKKFDIDNENSPLKNLLKPNRRIQAWLGAEAENITAENPPTFTRNSIAYLSNGTQVAANKPRFEQGAPGFGKAIMMEEGTTNLLQNPSFETGDFTNWYLFTGYGGATYEVTSEKTWHGSYSVKITADGTASASVGISQSMASATAGVTYTFSVKLAGTLGANKVYLVFRWQTADNTLIKDDNFLISEMMPQAFKTYSATATAPENTAKMEVHVRIVKDAVGVIYVDAAQLEAKPYATSFIDGTRAAETLTIPTAGVLNPQEGTVECWVKDFNIIPLGGLVLNCRQSDGVNAGVQLGVRTDSNIIFFNINTVLISGPDKSTLSGWHYFAIRWSADRASLFIDGSEYAYLESPTLFDAFASLAYIGSNNDGTRHCNTLIDDLRISNKARSDEEILAAYQNNVPQPVDEWTTYKLSFDGHLYRNTLGTAWIPLGTFWSLDWDSPDDSLEAIVTARDRMELLRKGTYQTSQVQQNKSLYELAEAVLRDAGLTSDEYIIDTELQNIIIPYAWFNPVSHREALRRIAEAGLAVAFQNRDGKIQIESFLITGDEPVLDITEEDYFPPLRTPSRQQDVANEIIVDTQPLRPAANPEEVYRSNDPVMIPANSTQTLTVYYNKTPVIDAVATLDSPPAGVAITEATYYGWGASIKIANSTGTDQQVTLVITGRPLTVQNKERAVARDEASILENGLLTYEFPANPLVQTLAQAQAIANTLLASVKDPRRDIEVDWRGNPALELGDRVTVKGKDYHVIRQEINWQGYLSARLTGRRAT